MSFVISVLHFILIPVHVPWSFVTCLITPATAVYFRTVSRIWMRSDPYYFSGFGYEIFIVETDPYLAYDDFIFLLQRFNPFLIAF